MPSRLFKKFFGDVLLSHRAAPAVPSALKSLTSVFGMGTGGASSLSTPKILYQKDCANYFVVKPHGLLVPVCSMRYRTYTSGLSNS